MPGVPGARERLRGTPWYTLTLFFLFLHRFDSPVFLKRAHRGPLTRQNVRKKKLLFLDQSVAPTATQPRVSITRQPSYTAMLKTVCIAITRFPGLTPDPLAHTPMANQLCVNFKSICVHMPQVRQAHRLQ